MLDSKQLSDDLKSEATRIRKEKDSVILLNERYNTPGTSLLLFHFEPESFASAELRLKNASIGRHAIDGKDIYLFDRYFVDSESQALRTYSGNAAFSRSSYASQSSREKGEEPARSMNNKEKWEFFAKPPQPINEIYKLLSLMAHKMNADISTLPWDVCDEHICASALAANKIESATKESRDMGKHEDFNTEEGIPFAIPILYKKDKSFFPGQFANGAAGNPWLVTLMVYGTAENFHVPEYGIGTVFCKNDGNIAFTADCQHTRIVLFEGDILHSIEESRLPAGVKTWRVSYVFKLIINPKEAGKSMKEAFFKQLQAYHKALK